MVQIRQLQQRAPRRFRLWRRIKLRFRIRRRRQLLKERLDDSRRNLQDLESEHGQSGDLFEISSVREREKPGILGFPACWGFAGTGRWLRLACSKSLFRAEAGVKWTINKRETEKEPITKVLAISDSDGSSYTERSWGKVTIATWMNGKGGRSLRAPLIGDSEDAEEQGVAEKRKEGIIGEKCCGCSGGRIWGSREKCKEITEIGASEVAKTEEHVGADEQAALPDDIIEMCLARTPFTSLMRARAVCKKWKFLTLSPHFLHTRDRIRPSEPWLFLFGLSRNGVCLGQIRALDPDSSRWHTIKAEILTGRLSYSVAAVNSVIFIVGGCSSILSAPSGRSDKDSPKTLKTVLRYSPLTGSWKNVCPLITERAAPIVGVFNLRGRKTSGSEFSNRNTGQAGCNRNLDGASDLHSGRTSPSRRLACDRGSRRGGELAVYGGAEIRGREMNGKNAAMELFGDLKKCREESCAAIFEADFRKLQVQRNQRRVKEHRTFGIIAVGGQGAWNEQLDSAEIYDPVTDNWRESASLPSDHGTPCAGVVCKNFFYVYTESNKLAAYDLEQDVWHSIRVSEAPARIVDYTPKLVSCRGRIFLLGVAWGTTSDGGAEMATRKIWELHQEPASTGWVSVSQHPDAPLDWNAVFVADEEIIFGVEMFKIFGQMLDFVTVCKISGSGGMAWERVSRMEMALHEMDPSSCLTKTAIVARL